MPDESPQPTPKLGESEASPRKLSSRRESNRKRLQKVLADMLSANKKHEAAANPAAEKDLDM